MNPLVLLGENMGEDVRSCDDDPGRCDRCPLHLVRCRGCRAAQRRVVGDAYYCNQGNCETVCDFCGGTLGSVVPTVCCKAPLRDVNFPELPQWGSARYDAGLKDYHSVDPLQFNHHGITMNQGSAGSVREDPYPPETEIVAVSIRHVWTKTKGWIAPDLKAHLKIPPGAKLLVTTMVKDEILEVLWEKDVHGGPGFKAVGIDYWMPILFSCYTSKNSMSNFFDSVRTMTSLKLGHGHFVPYVSTDIIYVDSFVIEAAKTIKNAVFNGQFLYTDTDVMGQLSSLLYWHYLLPDDVAFFVVGPSALKPITLMRRAIYPRPVYFISVNPWMCAFRGKTYTRNGKTVKDFSKGRAELVWENQRNFMRVCAPSPKDANLTLGERKMRDAAKRRAQLTLDRL